MTTPPIRHLLQHPMEPTPEQRIRASLEDLFSLADAAKESVNDLAWGFSHVLNQLEHEDTLLEPAIAERLIAWALAQWDGSSHAVRAQLCLLLVNVPSDQVVGFLANQLGDDRETQQAFSRQLTQLDQPRRVLEESAL